MKSILSECVTKEKIKILKIKLLTKQIVFLTGRLEWMVKMILQQLFVHPVQRDCLKVIEIRSFIFELL